MGLREGALGLGEWSFLRDHTVGLSCSLSHSTAPPSSQHLYSGRSTGWEDIQTCYCSCSWGSSWRLRASACILAGAASPGSELRELGAGAALLVPWLPPGHRWSGQEGGPAILLLRAGTPPPALSGQASPASPVTRPGSSSSWVVIISRHPHLDWEKPCAAVTTCPTLLVPSCPRPWPLGAVTRSPGPDEGPILSV